MIMIIMIRKQLIVCAGLFVTILMSAMDEPAPFEPAVQPGICYLAFMLPEIQDHIASFLAKERETKKEFVERTKKPVKIPEHYFEFSTHKKNSSTEEEPYGLKGRRQLICPDVGALNPQQTLFAILKKRARVAPVLTIIDLQKEEDEQGRIYYQNTVDCLNYKVITLSPQGSMIAYTRWLLYGDGVMGERRFQCDVQKINSCEQSKRTFDIPKNFIPGPIAFNKQCTRLIIHREKIADIETNESDHMLFSLKEKDQKSGDNAASVVPIRPFNKYVQAKRICNSIEFSRS